MGLATSTSSGGSYYGRWRGPDGRLINKKIGKARTRGDSGGVTRAEAERGLRRLLEAESRRPPPSPEERPRTVDEVADAVRERIALEGARLSYRQNCESMQRIHVSPAIGTRRIDAVTQDDVERLASVMLRKGLAPKTVRNVMTFLYGVFAHAETRGWVERNPVAGRRAGGRLWPRPAYFATGLHSWFASTRVLGGGHALAHVQTPHDCEPERREMHVRWAKTID